MSSKTFFVELISPRDPTGVERAELEVFAERPMRLKLSAPSLGDVWETGGDAFEALFELRRNIEPLGYRVLCNGARADAWPSPMTRQMGRGFAVYLFRRGEPALESDRVRTFDPAPRDHVTTTDKQQLNYEAWLRSLSATVQSPTVEVLAADTVDEALILGALSQMGVVGAQSTDMPANFHQPGRMIRATFPGTGMSFTWGLPVSNDTLRKGLTAWEIATVGVFFIASMSRDNCILQIRTFIQNLAIVSGVNFVVTYAGKDRWAYRDDSGLHFESALLQMRA